MLDKWKLYKEIVFCSRFTEADKMVAFALLDHYNAKIKKVFPTNRRVVAMTGLSYRQVQRSTKKFHEYGVIEKMSNKGKNFYKPNVTWKLEEIGQTTTQSSPIDDKPDMGITTALSPPSKPTSLTSNINIDGLVKNIAKQKSLAYRNVVDSGNTYQQNMDRKYRKMMVSRLSADNYSEWLKTLQNSETRDKAIDYARLLCGK